jgi:hypothetical protein
LARLAALSALLAVFAVKAAAQVKLGLEEARALVEHSPYFLGAAWRGECVNDDAGLDRFGEAVFDLRANCTLDWDECGSCLIGVLSVDLETGIITTDGHETVETPELVALRRTLFGLRAAELIRAPEAACLLTKIPIPSIPASCKGISVERDGDEKFLGTIQDACAKFSQGGAREFTIDRYTGLATDVKTGAAYQDLTFWRFREKLRSAHETPMLTLQAALRLAQSEAAVAALTRAGLLNSGDCVAAVQVDRVKSVSEFWFDIWSGCGSEKRYIRIYVDRLSGAIWNFNTGNVESPDLSRLQRAAVAEAKSPMAAVAAAIAKECAASSAGVKDQVKGRSRLQ